MAPPGFREGQGERVNCLATVNVVQMRGITKTFGAVVANHKVGNIRFRFSMFDHLSCYDRIKIVRNLFSFKIIECMFSC